MDSEVDVAELLSHSKLVSMRIVKRNSPRVSNDGTKFATRNRFDEFDLIMVYEEVK